MRTKHTLVIGTSLALILILVAIFGPFLRSTEHLEINLALGLAGPSLEAPLGRDPNGSDLLTQLILGARISLLVAIAVVSLSSLLGLVIGSVSGYFGGRLDWLIMRVVDMVYAFPGFLLALGLIALLGPALENLIFAMCLTGWAGYARLVRGEILHLKERDHVLAARSLGASHLRLLVWHVWPNLIPLLCVQMTFGMAASILTESSLSFLGLGASPQTPTWGAMLNTGRQYLLEAPSLSFYPGLCIVFVVLAFNLLGDGLRDALDPRQES